MLLDLVIALAKSHLVLVFSVGDTPIWAHSLSWQPSLRAFSWHSFVMSFLYQSRPTCTLVGSENLFMTPPSYHLLPSTPTLVDLLQCINLISCQDAMRYGTCVAWSLSGHSFQISGTTHLLLIGVDTFIVMVQGRSTACLEYWWLCEEIILTLIGFYLSSRTSVLSTMSVLKQCINSL